MDLTISRNRMELFSFIAPVGKAQRDRAAPTTMTGPPQVPSSGHPSNG
jgi:hypothetical protein